LVPSAPLLAHTPHGVGINHSHGGSTFWRRTVPVDPKVSAWPKIRCACIGGVEASRDQRDAGVGTRLGRIGLATQGSEVEKGGERLRWVLQVSWACNHLYGHVFVENCKSNDEHFLIGHARRSQRRPGVLLLLSRACCRCSRRAYQPAAACRSPNTPCSSSGARLGQCFLTAWKATRMHGSARRPQRLARCDSGWLRRHFWAGLSRRAARRALAGH
jgi:hypothetical protein